jgi:hypothetical protein
VSLTATPSVYVARAAAQRMVRETCEALFPIVDEIGRIEPEPYTQA